MSENIDALLKRYGLDIATVVNWGKEKYPSFATNVKALIALYLKSVKGVSLSALGGVFGASGGSGIGSRRVGSISEIKRDENVIIKLLNLGEVDSWKYRRCAKCWKTVPRGAVQCPSCGEKSFDERVGYRYIVGDSSGENIMLVSFGEAIPEGEITVRVAKRWSARLNAETLLLRGLLETEEGAEKKAGKIRTWFKINSGSAKVADFDEFLRNNKMGLTVEEAIKLVGGRVEGGMVYGQ